MTFYERRIFNIKQELKSANGFQLKRNVKLLPLRKFTRKELRPALVVKEVMQLNLFAKYTENTRGSLIWEKIHYFCGVFPL